MKPTPTTRIRGIRAIVLTFGVLFATVSPLFICNTAFAANGQLTNRKINLGSSEYGRSTSYSVSFNVASTTDIQGIVVDFCNNSPLIGSACTTTNGIQSPATGAVTVRKNGGSTVGFTVHPNSTSTGQLILVDTTGITSLVAGDTITFSFNASNPLLGCGGSPVDKCTFYARILTYAVYTGAIAYSHTTPGTHLDDGGVALSLAHQLTTNARVQEQLVFCVGTTTVDNATSNAAATNNDCRDISGTTIDLGVVDSSAVYISGPSNTAANNNGVNGIAMVRTNAVNGVLVQYMAEQGTGSNHVGTLRVTGATCNAGTVSTDQCFNAQGTTQGTFTAGTEKFGMTVAGVNCGTTNARTAYNCTYTSNDNNLKPADTGGGDPTTYRGGGTSGSPTYGTGNGFAWDESGSPAKIASSSTVVDSEALILKFAATSGITTPTGSYGITSTYIATATF